MYEIPPITDGGTSITFPSYNAAGVSFQLPTALPSGQYLVRIEHIALHSASTFGGAQFYVSTSRAYVYVGDNQLKLLLQLDLVRPA